MERNREFKLSEDPNVPMLDAGNWVNLTEAAELLGFTRQHSYKRAESGGYDTLHRVGHQPMFVVNMSEIESILAQRKAREEERQLKADAEVLAKATKAAA